MEIERNVPIPPAANDRGISATLRKLKKGESVFIEGKTASEMGGFIDHCGLAGKVTRRTIEGGCRIWRIR